MAQMENTTQPQASSNIPQIAGNLWWDDVRLGFGLLFAGFLVYLVPFLIHRFVVSAVSGIFYVISALLLLAGLKMCMSVPAESRARVLAVGAFAGAMLTLISFFVLLGAGYLKEAGIGLLALGLLTNILLALFIRGVAGYLQARSLELLSRQYAFAAAVLSVAIIVATRQNADLLADALSLLVIGVQLFLVGHAFEAVARELRGLAPEVKMPTSGIIAAVEAAAHTPEHDTPTVVHAPFFSDKQWKALETSDKSAGRAVIGLMTAIFLIGVFLYTIVAAIAALQGHA